MEDSLPDFPRRERIDSDQLEPLAPPPASCPPPPPSTPPNGGNDRQEQHKSGIQIRNYETEPFEKVENYQGDINLRPNTGHANSADGESMIEMIRRLRYLNLGACSWACLTGIFRVLGKAFTLQPARAILAIYLMAFSILIVAQELKLFQEIVLDLFGFLDHPFGKSFLLIVMGGMATGQGSVLDYLLGLVFFGSAIYTLYAYCKYPEFRQRTFQHEDLIQTAKESAKQYAWANPEVFTEATGLLSRQSF